MQSKHFAILMAMILLASSIIVVLPNDGGVASAHISTSMTLHKRLAYGSAVAWGDAVFYFGGMDGDSIVQGEVQLIEPSSSESSTIASFPALIYTSAVKVDSQIFVFGGQYQNGTSTRAVYLFNPTTYEYLHVADMPNPKSSVGVVYTGWDVFLFGGYNWTSGQASDEIYVFDPDTYSIVPAVGGVVLPEPRAYSTVVWTGTYAYILGGLDATGTPTDTIFMFDSARNTCQPVNHLGFGAGHPVRLSLAVSNSAGAFHNGTVYIYGGSDGTQLLNTIMKFNPTGSYAWYDNDRLPNRLSGSSAVPLSGSVFVLGGEGDGYVSDSIFKHTPEPLHRWENIHQYGKIPQLLSSSTAVSVGPLDYVLGGINNLGATAGIVYRYDPLTGRIAQDGTMFAPRMLASSVVYNGRIWTFGGQAYMVPISQTVQWYDPKDASTGASADLVYNVAFAGAATYGNFAYIFGGSGTGGMRDTVLQVNLDTGSSSVVGTLPYKVSNYTLAVDGENAYLVGGSNEFEPFSRNIIKYDMSQKSSILYENVLPRGISHATGGYSDEDGLVHIFGGECADPPYILSGELILDFENRFVDIGRVGLPDSLYFAACTQGRLTIFGGHNGTSWSNKIFTYSNAPFRPYDGKSIACDYNLPYGLAYGAMATLEGIHYIFGGKSEMGSSAKVFFVRPDNGLLYHVANMPFPIHGSSAVTIGSYVYIFGGYAPGQVPVERDEIWRFRFTGAAFEVQDTGFKLPSGRYNASVATDKTVAFLVGGVTSGGETNEILSINPVTGETFTNYLPVALRSSIAGFDKERVIVASGKTPTKVSKAIYTFDPETKDVATVGQLPLAVTGAFGGYGWGYFFVAGGRTSYGHVSDRIMVYDVAKNVTTFADFRIAMPAAGLVATMGCEMSFGGISENRYNNGMMRTAYEPRSHTYEDATFTEGSMFNYQSNAGAAYDGDNVYLFGGLTGTSPQTPTSAIYGFDKELGTGFNTGQTLTSQRTDMTAAYNSLSGSILAFGGNYGGTYYTDIFEYKSGTVSPYAYSMIAGGSGSGAVSIDDRVYLLGGRDGMSYYSEVASYDPTGLSAPSVVDDLPFDLAFFGSGYDDAGGCVYLFGGLSASEEPLDTIVRWDPLTYNATVMTSRLPSPRSLCSAVYDPEAEVFVIFGGELEDSSLTDQILFYDPAKDILTIANTTLDQPAKGMMAVYDETMALGGTSSTGGLNSVLSLRYIPNAPTGSDFNSGNSSGDITMDVTSPHVYYYNLKDTLTETSALNWQLEAGQSYFFEMEAGHGSGFSVFDRIDIYGWFDNGDDLSLYNATAGGLTNFHFRYENSTATGNTATFTQLWPDVDDMGGFSGMETNLPPGDPARTQNKRFRFYFSPSYFTRWADGCVGGSNAPDFGNCWNTAWALNDPDSWNFHIQARDSFGNENHTYDEFGVFKYQQLTVQAGSPWLNGAPGTPWTPMETSDPGNITIMMARMNAPYRLLVNITDLTGPAGTIDAFRVGLSGGDIVGMTAFLGPGLANAQYPRASAATWCAHDYAPTEYGGWAFTLLNWFGEIPAGTNEGVYEGGITYRTQTSSDPSVVYVIPNNDPEDARDLAPGEGASIAGPDITFSATVEDLDGDDLTVEFFIDGASFQTVTVGTGDTASVVAAMAVGPHTWYVTVSDGIATTTSPVLSFTVV